jgi:hypothetical protein
LESPRGGVFLRRIASFSRLIMFDKRGVQPLQGVPGEWRLFTVDGT